MPRPAILSLVTVVFCLWLTGVSFLLASCCRELSAVRRLAKRARSCEELSGVREVARAIGLTWEPPVLVSEAAECSLVIGPWRPLVLLCRADLLRLSSQEQRALLAHELSHIRRWDLWAGIIPYAARILFFFHPLIWFACREYDLARETACDADALRVSGLEPADYGRLLLKLSIPSLNAARYTGIATVGATSRYGILLRRRLLGLQNNGKPSATRQLWGSLLALVTAIGALSLNPVRVGAGYRQTKPAIAPLTKHLPVTPINNHLRAVTHAIPPAQVKMVRAAEAGTIPVIDLASVLPGPALKYLPMPSTSSAAQNVNTKTHMKEDQTMPGLPNGFKPKLSTALAAAAAVTAGFTVSHAAAQDAPVPPVAPEKASAAPAPVPSAPQETPAPAAPAPPAPAVSAQPGPEEAYSSHYQYTLRRGDSYMHHTRDKGVAEGQRALAKAQPGDCLVVDREGKRYLITDADTLHHIQEAFAPVDAMGKQMEARGKRMEDMSKPMEELGKQMEAIGSKMEGIGREMEEQGERLGEAIEAGKPEADRKAIQEKMRDLQEKMKVPQGEMRALSQKMHEQSEKMRPLSEQMREYGRQMRGLVREAQQKMDGIIDTAFQNNLAVEQKNS